MIHKLDYYWGMIGLFHVFLLTQLVEISTTMDLLRWVSADRPITTISFILFLASLGLLCRNFVVLAFAFDNSDEQKRKSLQVVVRSSVIIVGLLVSLLFLSRV